MENLTVEKYMRLIEPLAIEVKLELLTRLSESLKKTFKASPTKKEALLDEISGAWKSVDESIIEDILKARTISDKDLNLD